MKRLFASLVIILMLSGLSYLGNVLTKSQYEKINDCLTLSEDYIKKEDYNNAQQMAKEAEEKWLKSEKMLSVFINHQLLEEVGLKLSVIKPLCRKETMADCTAAIKEAKTALIHMKNGQIPSFETVL